MLLGQLRSVQSGGGRIVGCSNFNVKSTWARFSLFMMCWRIVDSANICHLFLTSYAFLCSHYLSPSWHSPAFAWMRLLCKGLELIYSSQAGVFVAIAHDVLHCMYSVKPYANPCYMPTLSQIKSFLCQWEESNFEKSR